MSDLNPRGVKVVVGGEEHELLFTVNVIDEIQGTIGKPLFDVMGEVSRAVYTLDDLDALHSFEAVLAILVNEDGGHVTPKELAKKIMWNEVSGLARSMVEAFGISLPEPDDEDEEDEDPEDEARPKEETAP